MLKPIYSSILHFYIHSFLCFIPHFFIISYSPNSFLCNILVLGLTILTACLPSVIADSHFNSIYQSSLTYTTTMLHHIFTAHNLSLATSNLLTFHDSLLYFSIHSYTFIMKNPCISEISNPLHFQ